MRRGRGLGYRLRGHAGWQLIAGLLLCLIIIGLLAWVIVTWPRPGWRQAPVVPTAPAPGP